MREQFFGRLPLRFFVDHFYRPEPGYVSNRLFVVGTTDAAWQRLGSPSALASPESVGRRLEKLKSRFGSDYFHPVEMEQALLSKSLRTVRLHALGSAGTNIARASYRFVKAQRIRARTEIVVHPDKVEPMEYAQIAAEEQRDGVLSLHTECAVYYELDRLFETRSTELVFASHYYMPLDGMQLATRSDSPVVTRRIASHPSPQGLVEPWVRDGAELVHASSNSHAAAMVLSGEADMCVTTASAVHSMDLKTVEDFGSPTMLFTLGTPLDTEQIRQLF